MPIDLNYNLVAIFISYQPANMDGDFDIFSAVSHFPFTVLRRQLAKKLLQ